MPASTDMRASKPLTALRSIAESKLGRLVGTLVVALSFVYLGRTIWRTWPEIEPLLGSARPGWLLTAVALILVAEFAFAAIWRRYIRLMGGTLSYVSAFKAYALSSIARFLPGAVATYAGRAALAVRYGEDIRVATAATAAETVSSGVVALSLAAAASVSLVEAAPIAPWALRSVSVVTLGIVLALAPRLITHIASSEFQRPEITRQLVPILGAYAGVWIILGASLLAAIESFDPTRVSLGDIVSVTGALGGAWLLGLIALVVPGGLGVREASLTLALSPLLGEGLAAAVALSHRFLWWLAVLLLYAIGGAVRRSQHDPIGRGTSTDEINATPSAKKDPG